MQERPAKRRKTTESLESKTSPSISRLIPEDKPREITCTSVNANGLQITCKETEPNKTIFFAHREDSIPSPSKGQPYKGYYLNHNDQYVAFNHFNDVHLFDWNDPRNNKMFRIGPPAPTRGRCDMIKNVILNDKQLICIIENKNGEPELELRDINTPEKVLDRKSAAHINPLKLFDAFRSDPLGTLAFGRHTYSSEHYGIYDLLLSPTKNEFYLSNPEGWQKWSIINNKLKRVASIPLTNKHHLSLAITPNGETLITCSRSKSDNLKAEIKFWSASGKCAEPFLTYTLPDFYFAAENMMVTPSGNFLILSNMLNGDGIYLCDISNINKPEIINKIKIRDNSSQISLTENYRILTRHGSLIDFPELAKEFSEKVKAVRDVINECIYASTDVNNIVVEYLFFKRPPKQEGIENPLEEKGVKYKTGIGCNYFEVPEVKTAQTIMINLYQFCT